VARAIVDDGELLELRPALAANIVTALASVGGRPVGIVANQPQTLAGTLDIAASQKGARFVAFCDAFNIPLLTVVDTPGFSPGKDQEWRGMSRHGAQMAFAYARATVPRISLTLRKSYGGAFIVMDSKTMGNDLALAWPTAEIAVMGAKGGRDPAPSGHPEEQIALAADYEERLLNPYRAAGGLSTRSSTRPTPSRGRRRARVLRPARTPSPAPTTTPSRSEPQRAGFAHPRPDGERIVNPGVGARSLSRAP
jgi:propionyl-CoA carboxylase beta chain